jgi:hypothetical protein
MGGTRPRGIGPTSLHLANTVHVGCRSRQIGVIATTIHYHQYEMLFHRRRYPLKVGRDGDLSNDCRCFLARKIRFRALRANLTLAGAGIRHGSATKGRLGPRLAKAEGDPPTTRLALGKWYTRLLVCTVALPSFQCLLGLEATNSPDPSHRCRVAAVDPNSVASYSCRGLRRALALVPAGPMHRNGPPRTVPAHIGVSTITLQGLPHLCVAGETSGIAGTTIGRWPAGATE